MASQKIFGQNLEITFLQQLFLAISTRKTISDESLAPMDQQELLLLQQKPSTRSLMLKKALLIQMG